MGKYNYEKLIKKVENCKKMNIEDIDINQINDLKDIKISKRKNSQDRIMDFLKQAKNPYFFKCNDKIVQITFSDNGKTADECLTDLLSEIYR